MKRVVDIFKENPILSIHYALIKIHSCRQRQYILG